MTVSEALAPVDRALEYINGRGLITMVGLRPDVRDALTNEDAEQLLVSSGALEDVSRWILADVLVWAENKAAATIGNHSSREFWDERDRLWDLVLNSCKSDISKHTCYNLAACAKAWPHERRRYSETISFEHHRILTGRDEEEQEYWIDLASDGGWSVKRLRNQLFGGHDPLLPVAVMSTPVELWPTENAYRHTR